MKLIVTGNVAPARRNYNQLFQCLLNVDIRKSERPIVLKIIGRCAHCLRGTVEDFRKGPNSYLDLDEATLQSFQQLLRHDFVNVETFDGISLSAYYREISHSDFMVSFINMESGNSYLVDRASSSAEMALVNSVPIVLPPSILRQYSCWKSSPLHRKVSKQNDCASLEAALLLTNEELDEWRAEAVYCKEQYMSQAIETFGRILNSSMIATHT